MGGTDLSRFNFVTLEEFLLILISIKYMETKLTKTNNNFKHIMFHILLLLLYEK